MLDLNQYSKSEFFYSKYFSQCTKAGAKQEQSRNYFEETLFEVGSQGEYLQKFLVPTEICRIILSPTCCSEARGLKREKVDVCLSDYKHKKSSSRHSTWVSNLVKYYTAAGALYVMKDSLETNGLGKTFSMLKARLD